MSPSNLVSRIRAEVARTAPPPVLIGFSGGPDSLCLADALLSAGGRVVLAHLNHRLRGAASDGDEVFVREFAATRGVTCICESIDVAAAARACNESIELTARRARYAFLARAAAQANVTCVAVAHHADDQAETVLLRLLRGTGIEGLRAMAARAPLPDSPELTLLRPLLRITRAEIERYCADMNLQPRHDNSNDSAEHTRNRVRLELLPLLHTFNPGIKRVLARLADLASADHDMQIWATRRAFDELASAEPGAVHVDRVGWRALPAGLQRTLLRECVRTLRSDLTNLSYDGIEEARTVLLSTAAHAEIALMADVRVNVHDTGFSVQHSDDIQNR
ncbi:MAG: tRNA lysidine(34) synthetase TilS [Chloroflexi bacterium]|nr:tRNA lysidine(34) synthetase TilS [Chloroflexota bacterium]